METLKILDLNRRKALKSIHVFPPTNELTSRA